MFVIKIICNRLIFKNFIYLFCLPSLTERSRMTTSQSEFKKKCKKINTNNKIRNLEFFYS